MGEDCASSLNTELASGSLNEDDFLAVDLMDRLDSEDLCALRKHFFTTGDPEKHHPSKFAAWSQYCGLPLNKEEFIKAMDSVVGNSVYSLSASKLFQELDTTNRGVIWWEEVLDHVIERIGHHGQDGDSWKPIDFNMTVHSIPHCKRETIIKVVPIDTESTFCYALVSKFGRVGVYDGWLNLCESYVLRLVGGGINGDQSEGESRRRITSTWVTDAVYLPDAGALLIVTSDRSIHVMDASGLVHAPLCLVAGLNNSPQCLAYSSTGSMLFFGDDHGNITTMTFHQPKISLFRRKHPDKLDKYYWVELEAQSEWVSVSVDHAVHADAVRQIAYCPDNETVVSCSQDPVTTLVVRHLTGRRTPYIFKLARGVRCFHMERTLKLLATGSNDGVVRLWNPVVTNQPVVSLFGHKMAVVDVLILHHMSAVFSCSGDGVVKVWDIDDQYCIQTVPLNFPSFSVLGKTIEFGTQSLYPGPSSKPAQSTPKPKIPSFCSDVSTSIADTQVSFQPTWSSTQMLVACCNHVAILHLAPQGSEDIATPPPLPPPSREHHASVPSPWQAAEARGIITPESTVYDHEDRSPPETPSPPERDTEFTKQSPSPNADLSIGHTLRGSNIPGHNLNIRRALQERRTREMHMFVARCAPHLALQLHELSEVRFSKALPITTRMRECGVDASEPDRLLSAMGSTSASTLGSTHSSSHRAELLVPEWPAAKLGRK